MPKVDLAIELWTRFPLEIEADLSHRHGRRIREWHQGQMSSRELLTLILYSDEDSEYQKSRRDYGWTVHQDIQKTIANELMDFRAWYVAMHNEDGGYDPIHYESPGETQVEEVFDDDIEERRNEVFSQMQRW